MEDEKAERPGGGGSRAPRVELKLVVALHRVANELDRRTARIARQEGLSLGQFSVLEALYHKGDLCVGEVQQKILSTGGTIPVIVRHLEGRGLLERRGDPRDRRRSILHLTPAGAELVGRVFPQNERMLVESMAALDPDQKQLLLDLLKQMGVHHE